MKSMTALLTRDRPTFSLLRRSIGICLLLVSFPVGAQNNYAPYPAPDSGYVSDNANLLTKAEEERIEQWLYQVEEKSGVEIAVVTIGSIKDYPQTENGSIENFAKELFNKYGIGNLPKNDGVLLLVAVNDRKVRIELGEFYGLHRDGDASRIVQNDILPYFKEEDYAGGITNGVESIISQFAGMTVSFPWEILYYLVGIVVVTLIAISLFKNGKRGWGWVCVGIIFILLLLLLKTITLILSNNGRGRSSGWGSGGFGGGGFSGGGFGGGSSGGGGATGSW